jgi:hypothetical protein
LTPLVPLMMFGWIAFSVYMFKKREPQDAAVYVVVGGVMFLPTYSFPIPVLQDYDKIMAIAVSLLIGHLSCGARRRYKAKFEAIDVFILVWCTFSPLATSLTNGLGLYDGLTNMLQNSISWGVFYFVGRKYFGDPASLRKIMMAMVIGALIYLPLILYEIRMSPQLSRIVYGFFPHSFLQHIRYGGYRPIVFMEHGLMVALWSGVAAVSAFWLWRSRAVTSIKKVPMILITVILVGETFLCKSSGAIVLMGAGIALFLIIWKTKSPAIINILMALTYGYIAVRATNLLPISDVNKFLSKYFNQERVDSFFWRLREEDLFGAKTRQQPLFGWGQFGRGWPLDPATGKKSINFIDAFWLLNFNTYGLVGLASSFLAICAGPMRMIKAFSNRRVAASAEGRERFADCIALSLIIALFLVDCISNAMFNPVYILATGALVSAARTLERGASLGGAQALDEPGGAAGGEPYPEAEAAKA